MLHKCISESGMKELYSIWTLDCNLNCNHVESLSYVLQTNDFILQYTGKKHHIAFLKKNREIYAKLKPKNLLWEIVFAFHEHIRNRFHLWYHLQAVLSLATISIQLIIIMKEEKHVLINRTHNWKYT